VGCNDPVKPTPDPYPDGPKISCPAPPPPVTSPNNQAVTVQYGTATATGGAPGVAVSCAPASGAAFPVGSTAVVCTATDARARTDSCFFNVVVQPPAPILSVTSFVAFGDSITYGEDGNPEVSCGSNNNSVARTMGLVRPLNQVAQPYPAVLRQLLAARYTTQSSALGVANRGNPGEPAGQPATLDRFKQVLTAGPGPGSTAGPFQSVLLMEGTNDIFYSNGDPRAGAEIQAAVAGLRSMVDEAKSRRLQTFLATVPPMVPGSDRSCGNHEVAPLNDQIRSLAAQEGVTLVDVYAGLGASYAQYIGPDGLHPNQSGYSKIADIFFQVLKSTLERQPTLTAPASRAPAARPQIAPPPAVRRGARRD
jgi:lysophospholipase L1-like esterase